MKDMLSSIDDFLDEKFEVKEANLSVDYFDVLLDKPTKIKSHISKMTDHEKVLIKFAIEDRYSSSDINKNNIVQMIYKDVQNAKDNK